MLTESQKEMLKEFAAGRKNLAADKFSPVYHFVPPVGLSNDPNGLCFWRGNWHLFYQFTPPGSANPSWGHTVSKDLLHWKDMPVAIAPGPETGSWSGSTWVEEDRVIAMYHGFKLGNMVAISSDDDLLNWEKLTGTTVLPNPLPIWCCSNGTEKINGKNIPAGMINIVYDPCIWKKGYYYYSLSGGSVKEENITKRHRSAFLFRSADLKNWEYMHEFIVYGYVRGLSPGFKAWIKYCPFRKRNIH